MLLRVALITSESHINVVELNVDKNTMDSKRIDSVGLPDENFDVLLYDQDDELSGLASSIEKEQKFYPIAPIQSLGISKSAFDDMGMDALVDLYNKVSSRWILNNNIKTIEQIYPTVTYLKDLWVKDRNSFFEELWFTLKTNLCTTNLNIIFHDLKEPTEKQAEKGDKPKLCYSYVQGTKLPNLFEGKDKEAHLIKEYDAEFNNFFNITEYSKEKGQLTACAKIGLSPVLIMAKLPNFNQLQQSILIALFTGLQES
jgi:hypothetical protein